MDKRSTMAAAEAETERLKTALTIYADPANWTTRECIDDDGGGAEYCTVWTGEGTDGYDLARAALNN